MSSSYLTFGAAARGLRSTWHLIVALTLATGALVNLPLTLPVAEAAGTISGTAFLDYNQDGVNNLSASAGLPAVDKGVDGVQVQVFDSTGALRGSAVTGADGTYSLAAAGTGPYRVEFTLPAGYQPSGEGADNGTTVQFVPDGDSVVDIGLSRPSEYCQNNPLECTPRYVNGAANTGSLIGNTGGLVAFPEDSDSDSAAGLITTTVSSNIGATWGLAWRASTNTLYAGAVAKRHVGFGPGGPTTIYQLAVDPSTGLASTTSVFFDLASLPGGPAGTTITGRDLSDDDYAAPSYDVDAFARAGTIGLGDLDLSDDGETLYVVSLEDRTLYALPIASPTTGVGTAINLPAAATDCTDANDLRPWAVEARDGEVYVGVVCSAGTSLSRADLRAYVLRLNGAAFDLVAEAPLNYPRGCATLTLTLGQCYPAEWQPWRDTVASVCPDNGPCDALAYDKQIIYPQPIVADIEFDNDGALILGMMDRAGNQWGNANYAPTTAGTPITVDLINASGTVSETLTAGDSTDLFEGATAGDILRLCPNLSGGYDLENDATCGSVTTAGAGSTPQQGPGGGEYYWQDMFTLGTRDSGSHMEITLGGLKLVPGRTEISLPVFDPNDNFRAGGVVWLGNGTGARTRSYEIFGLDSAGSLGKAAGLGDIEALCDDAPIEIGNRVWVDSDANGIQDPDESPLVGVTVNLYNQSGTQIGTTTTDTNGEYYFGGVTDRNLTGGQSLLPNTAYSVRVPLNQTPITSGSYTLTTTDASGNSRDEVDSDATVSGSDAIISLITGDAGTNDHTFDIGFTTGLALGNLVWGDLNNNGLFDTGEAGIDGVAVRLYNSSGAELASTSTSGGGLYLFSGLAPGDYYVEITPPEGACSSTGTPGSATGPYEGTPGTQPPDPDANPTDSDDNGYGVGTCGAPTYVIRSSLVTLTVGGEPTSEDGNANSNLTVDFGLIGTLSLGDLVWLDVNNDGLVSGGEAGLSGVTVNLLSSTGTQLATTTTNASGLYSFANLVAGDYIVEVAPSAGYCSSTGAPGAATASGPYEGNPGTQPPDPDTNVNDDDNGSGIVACGQSGYAIRSAAVTLSAGAEPIDDGDTDANSNLSVDFGLFRPVALGNLVWGDTDNNGLVNGAEVGIDTVTINLYNASGTLISTTVTAAGGAYSFPNLAPGDYYVVLTPPANVCSSTGTNGSATGPYEGNPGTQPPDPDNDVNNDDNGYGVGVCGQPGYAIRSSVITLTAGGEPTNDGDTDNNSNLTVDFGLAPAVSLGNLVWVDSDNNGLVNGAEAGLNGVAVRLYSSDGTLLASTTTAGGGLYSFTGLSTGEYYVEITPPAGYCSSTGTPGSATGPYEGTPGTQPPDPDNDVNNDDNGYSTGACGTAIRTAPITLSIGAEPINDGDTDANSNLTVDFGLIGTLSLGDLVWLDVNNDGLVSGGEAGLSGVTVNLLSSTGTQLATTTTNASGLYSFANLVAGDYIVEVAPSAGYCSSTGAPGAATASGPYEGNPGTQPPDPDTNVNDDDNGSGIVACGQSGYAIRSAAVTLSAGAEPIDDGDTDANSNLSVDFGLFRPVALGNLVWGDTDNNGLVNGAEVGIDTVTINLYNASGTLISTTVTAAGGAYSFPNLAPGDYYVVLTPPANVCSSTGTNGSATGPYEGNPGTQPPDPDNDVNNDDNGYGVGVCGQPGYVIRSATVTLTSGGEPTDDGDTDANTNLTVDFGLAPAVSLGNLVWVDSDNNGLVNGAEAGLNGVAVRLYSSDGTLLASTTTAGGGLYSFTGLSTGEYYVEITPPAGYCSSTGTPGSATGPYEGTPGTQPPDPDNDVNNDDNGYSTGACGTAIRTAPITLSIGAEPINDGDTDANSNLTVDFGLTPTLALGNLVWNDANDNGQVDSGESGVDGIPVQLFTGAGTPLGTTTTAGGGLYRFDYLAPGDYYVVITPTVGACSSSGGGLYEADPGAGQPPDPDGDINNDDNGYGQGTCGQVGYSVRSSVVTLTIGGEPTGDGDNSTDTNLTVDFGLVGALSLGNLVWNDVNNNGLVDGGETGVAGATVNLYSSAGTLLATTVTTNGVYSFISLVPGDYVVEVVPPANVCSSTGTNGSATGPYEGSPGTQPPDPDNDVNNDDNGYGVGVCGQPGYAIRSSVITLTAGGEPTNDGDTDNNSNLTVDFGLAPAVSLGNLVWVDSDNNGLVNGAEAGLNGVAVRLYSSDGTLLASTTTAGGGLYSFTGLSTGEYYVEITPPAGYCSSTGTPGSATGPYEGTPGTQPPDPDNDVNNDDNGYSTGACGTAIRTAPITLSIGAEPINDGDTDANSNLTVDFGLIGTLSLGDLVWLDVNNDGLVSGGEAGLSGVTVNLLSSTGTQLATTTTNASGLYSFANLVAGDYIVEVAPSAGYCSSTGAPGAATASGPYEGNPGTQPPDPDTNVNDDDNGSGIVACGQSGYAIRSAAVTLSAGAEPIDDGDTDANSNLSVDFGLFRPVALGNLVWGDTDNNGLVNGAEVGIDTVTINLYNASGTLISTTVTAAGGAYSFPNLAPGDYYVVLTPPANVCSSTGTNGSATGPYEGNPGTQPPDPDNDVNNDDNGYGVGVCGQPGYVIRSATVTLTSGGEPTDDGDTDANTNLTVDFGLAPAVSLGNLVWVDSDNNGLVNGAEAGLNGVAVRLYSSDGTLLASTTTAGGGLYSFTGLSTGEYYVEITPPAGYCSSTGTPGSTTGPYEGTPGTQPPDPDNDVNNDDNGYSTGACGTAIRTAPITLSIGAEPINDGDTDANSNLTVDFGLTPTLALGNLVWNDANDNGQVDSGESGVDGIPVQLFTGAGTPLGTTTTAGGGLYRFDYLAPGDYYVVITPTVGACSSSGGGLYEADPGAGQPPDPDGDINNDDNGYGQGTCGQVGYSVRSSVVTLTIGGEPTGDGDNSTDTNLTVDFGLVGALSLGNLVWNDVNNNGLVDGGETGVAGATVNLYSSAGTLLATTVTTNGVYSFISLVPGDYVVEVVPPAGYCSSTGTPGSATGPYEGNPGTQPPDPDNDVNNDDNGNSVGVCGQPGYAIRSSVITLTAGGEPTNDGDTDNNSNLTVDFGILQPASLGNLVWNDGDNDGVQDPGELGVSGVTVTLRDSEGTPIATTTTAPDGSYLFPSLPPGTYSVCFSNLPNGSSLTSSNTGGDDGLDSDADPLTGCTGTYTLTAGQQDLTVDAGLIGVPTAATLTLFEVNGPTNGIVTINWATAAEVDVVAYRVYRGTSTDFDSAARVCQVAATGPESSYSCTDSVSGTGPYTYWLTEVNGEGREQVVTQPDTVGAAQVRLLIPSILKR